MKKKPCSKNPLYSKNKLHDSFNEKFGTWSSRYNKKLIEEIEKTSSKD